MTPAIAHTTEHTHEPTPGVVVPAFVVVIGAASTGDRSAAPSGGVPWVGGMPVALRLALAARRGGAAAIHLVEATAPLASLLADRRLDIPVRRDPPAGDMVVIEVAADVVVDERAFAALAAAVSDGRARWLGDGAARIEARPPHAARASQGPPSPLIFAAPYAFPPIAIGTEADARRALGALLRAARRPSDGWTARFVNRPLSLALTRLLVPTGVRPDHVTFVGLLIGIAAGLVAARGSSEAFVVGAALLQLQSVLDGCDGELARLTHRDSRLGALLDSLGDDLSNYVFFAGLAIGLHRVTGGVAPLVLGAIVIGCGGLATATEVRWLAHAGGRGAFSYPIVDRIEGHAAGASRLGTALQPILERDTFVLLTFLATALGLVRPLLVAAAIGSIAALIAVARSQRSAGVPPKRR